MTTFKKTGIDTYNTSKTQLTLDQKQWSMLSTPVIVKEFTGINYVDACPGSTHLTAISTGPKVVIYNCRSGRAVSTISRFQRTAYGASYRQDGRLLAAGSEDSHIRLFDSRNNDQLRVFKGHTGPVRRVKFLPGCPQIASFSDDKTCAIWDIGDEKKILELKGHTDFIRSGCVSPCSAHLVMSGSDDRTVRVWDLRTGVTVVTLDHATSHVSDLICYPGGNVLASAAGSEVRIWDLTAGKLLSKLCRHHKDVTSLALASSGSRLMSGSLDHHLKVYDTRTYSVTHSIECVAPILSFAVMPKDSGLVVGMIAEGKGVLSLQKKVHDAKAADVNIDPINFKNPSMKVIRDYQPASLSRPDHLLRKFEHSKFLDTAVCHKNPAATVALLAELARRGGLQSALAGRDEPKLRTLLRFLYKNFSNPSYQAVLFDITMVFLDVYSDQITANSPLAPHLFRLQEMVTNNCQQMKEILQLEGDLRLLTATYEQVATTNRCIEQPDIFSK
uniref:U3 small nucleolar RNA-associated protein 15 homolog n=2 Tax=Hirondellea gigas TaxID=1518452 RepID=A0A6A7FVF2_9CRUS